MGVSIVQGFMCSRKVGASMSCDMNRSWSRRELRVSPFSFRWVLRLVGGWKQEMIIRCNNQADKLLPRESFQPLQQRFYGMPWSPNPTLIYVVILVDLEVDLSRWLLFLIIRISVDQLVIPSVFLVFPLVFLYVIDWLHDDSMTAKALGKPRCPGYPLGRGGWEWQLPMVWTCLERRMSDCQILPAECHSSHLPKRYKKISNEWVQVLRLAAARARLSGMFRRAQRQKAQNCNVCPLHPALCRHFWAWLHFLKGKVVVQCLMVQCLMVQCLLGWIHVSWWFRFHCWRLRNSVQPLFSTPLLLLAQTIWFPCRW